MQTRTFLPQHRLDLHPPHVVGVSPLPPAESGPLPPSCLAAGYLVVLPEAVGQHVRVVRVSQRGSPAVGALDGDDVPAARTDLDGVGGLQGLLVLVDADAGEDGAQEDEELDEDEDEAGAEEEDVVLGVPVAQLVSAALEYRSGKFGKVRC